MWGRWKDLDAVNVSMKAAEHSSQVKISPVRFPVKLEPCHNRSQQQWQEVGERWCWWDLIYLIDFEKFSFFANKNCNSAFQLPFHPWDGWVSSCKMTLLLFKWSFQHLIIIIQFCTSRLYTRICIVTSVINMTNCLFFSSHGIISTENWILFLSKISSKSVNSIVLLST